MSENDCDVIVVGCGIAGLSAAVTAAEHGARVAVIERAPCAERGGNTRYTESFWRMKSETEIADDFEERMGVNGAMHPDPALLREAAGESDQRSAVLRAAASGSLSMRERSSALCRCGAHCWGWSATRAVAGPKIFFLR